ncbi:unnamed protein product, partial [Vitis vinifera]
MKTWRWNSEQNSNKVRNFKQLTSKQNLNGFYGLINLNPRPLLQGNSSSHEHHPPLLLSATHHPTVANQANAHLHALFLWLDQKLSCLLCLLHTSYTMSFPARTQQPRHGPPPQHSEAESTHYSPQHRKTDGGDHPDGPCRSGAWLSGPKGCRSGRTAVGDQRAERGGE